ncbi:tyrosine-type recombinase/integrase [Carnobacterium maltaromaticum]|uniref:Tyrosine-type recombinase/integrase n=1 Tax=Carnobacterium maltaromaticum TaxID=2751 RepID=A0AAW9JZQ7_CARML|nr:tyrosine-type recombinase/integrase [Carnobacterium maltaromaticum]MDZ5760794.1 tyrosine-type recombinase/integrase [Carnobacterium maltaromaticum]
MYKVQEIILSNKEKRWLVLDDENKIVSPVMKFIKYKDYLKKSPNTLKTYCYHLKIYWDFLEKSDCSYLVMSLDKLSRFIHWLRTGMLTIGAIYAEPIRSEKTINQMVHCVVEFYDFLYRNHLISIDVKKTVLTEVFGKNKFKSFLDHLERGHQPTFSKSILKLKEKKKTVKVINQTEFKEIFNLCSNIRNCLMILIMFETGIRAHELLNLKLEDFELSLRRIIIHKSKTKAGENRYVYFSVKLLDLFQNYVLVYHTEDILTDYVFFNVSGLNKGKPLSYSALQKMIQRLSMDSRISFSAHSLRHSCATNLHENGLEVSIIQKILGHAHVQTTIDMYIHPTDKMIRKSWEHAVRKDGNINE